MDGMTLTAAELNLAFAREVAGLDPDQDCLYGNGRRIYENWREIIDHKGREVIDHEGVPACACGWTGKSCWHNTGHKKALPDYTKDWNAVIFEIHKRGLEWEKNHSSWLPEVGAKKIRVGTFQVRRIPKEKEPSGFWYAVDQEPNWEPCHALCLAAVRCVRAMEAIK